MLNVRSRRPMMATTLSTALREQIQDWFSARASMPEQQQIVAALTSLLTEQIAAEPSILTQSNVMSDAVKALAACVNAANRARGDAPPVVQ